MGLLAPVVAGSEVEARTGDAAFVRGMLDAEAALTRAQAALGLAPPVAAAVVTAVAADPSRFDVRDLALRARSGGNPVIPLVADLTAAVAERDPAAAPYVHRGATSQDIWDTAAMLVAVRALEPVLADLDRTAAALARLAVAHRDTPMPGRTLTQHAVPTTFGLKVAGWRSLVLAARERLAAVRAALPAQLGGAAGTLAAFQEYAALEYASQEYGTAAGELPRDLGGSRSRELGVSRSRELAGERAGDLDGGSSQEFVGEAGEGPGRKPDGDFGGGSEGVLRLLAAYAAEIGLAEPVLPWHTLRTPIADLAGALAFASGALGKLAADVLVLSRTEIGEVSEGTGGGSSAMPQKANPVRSVLIAAAARQVPALAAVLYGSLAAEDERPPGAWHAEWQPMREALRLAGGAAAAAADLAEGLRVHPRRMRDNLDITGGLIVAERLTAALAAEIGRERAGRAVKTAAQAVQNRAIQDRAVQTRAVRADHAEHAEVGADLSSADLSSADLSRAGLVEALLADPAVAAAFTGERLRELTDPARYTGLAGLLVNRALGAEERR